MPFVAHILGGIFMNINNDQSIDFIEANYDELRTEALKNIRAFKSDKIQIKSYLDSVVSNQFLIQIKDDKLREIIIFKLESNGIPFTQNGEKIRSTITGASLASGAISPEKLTQLKELANEIEKRIVNKFGLDALVRLNNNKDFKWGSLGEHLSNVYYFKTLKDCEEGLKTGYIKSSYEPLNIPKWHLPKSKPNNWEFPNTMKPLIEPEDKSPTIIIDGGDELAMALSSSGLPDLVSYGIQSTLLYPFFISVLRIGYDGSSDEEKEHKELLEENIETKNDLRKMLIDSLVRETKLKEELKNRMDKGESCKSNNQTYRLISALSKEGVLREALGKNSEVLSTDSISKIKEEATKNEKEVSNIISKVTLENLSDKRFFNEMILNGHNIAKDPVAYANFVKDLSKWKQASDKTFIRKLQRYLETQVLKGGMGLMWTALAAFEANAVINTLSSAGVKIPAINTIDTVLGSTAGILAASGQVAMVVYGISKTYGSAKTVMSLNEWVKKINQSELLDESSKKLVTDYLKSRKVHAVLGDCVGSSLLSAGQMMMVLGGPAGGLGSAMTLPGAGITILGIGITLANNVISAKKFHIIDSPNKEESKIIYDNTTLPQDGFKLGETEFRANLRWKADSLLDVSKNAQGSLLWGNIYSEIIKNCDGRKKPLNNKELQALSNKVINSVNHLYRNKFESNMKNLAVPTLEDEKVREHIKDSITNFFDNRTQFYHNITHNVISKKSIDISHENNIDKHLNVVSINPKYKDIVAIIDELKENKLWSETERKLIKRLVVSKKSNNNIKASYFSNYIRTIPIEQDRNVRIPSMLPFVDISFRNPVVPKKRKTLYIFKQNQFIEDLKNYKELDNDRKKVLDEVINSLAEERKNAIGRGLIRNGNLKLKSDVYRPLWTQCPQLVYQELLDKQITPPAKVNNVDSKKMFEPSKEKNRAREISI